MEPRHNRSPDIRPPQPGGAPPLRPGHRPTMSEFTTHPTKLKPAAPPKSAAMSHALVFGSAPGRAAVPPQPVRATEPGISSPMKHESAAAVGKAAKTPRPRSETAHAGWVGWIVFIILIVIALSPLLSGKILQNFPGNSATDSTGDQAIGCATALGPVTTTTRYDTKRGFPIVYDYSTTSTMKADCEGTPQTATGGHTSQSNPLGAAIDVAAAGVIAIIIARLWRTFFGIS